MCFRLRLILTFIGVGIPLFLLSQEEQRINNFKRLIKSETTSFSNDHFSKAQTFFFNDQWDSTLVHTSKVLTIPSLEEKALAYCYYFRGVSFFSKKLFDQAESEFLKIPNTFKFYQNVQADLGSIALESSQFEKALTFYKAVENLPNSKAQTIDIENVRDNIGLCYFHLGKYQKAEPYLLKSVVLQEQMQDTIPLIGSYGNLAALYYNQYKDDLAIPYYIKAYELAVTTNDFLSKQNTSLNMAIVEEDRKAYSNALRYRKEYEQWKDSLNDQNKIYATVEAEKKIAVEKAEKEMAIIKADNDVKSAQRNTYLYSAIILFVMLGVSLYFYQSKIRQNKIIRQQKEDLDALNATKDKLFSIVSHDLRSSVNAIKTTNIKLIQKLETKKFDEVDSLVQNNSVIVNDAYNLLDNLLNWALLQTQQTYFEITKLPLATIVDHVVYNYKAIITDKELTLQNIIDKKVTVFADKESLKIVLRNLLDNAIKFSNPKGAITIYTKNEDAEYCHIIVEDTGIGMQETTRLELLKNTPLLYKKQHENSIGTGLGMQLCKSMIQKNKGIFSIESILGKGTKMIISLPKNPT